MSDQKEKDRYQIEKKIGQGGIGAVYRARDTKLGRVVAIKRLLPLEETTSNRQAAADLKREASVLSTLANPHIVTIYDAGDDEDGVFVVMELIEGETLDKIVRHAALPIDDFVEVAHQCLGGLIAAHEANLLHRDIKPKNIMVSFLPSGKFQVKLLDFGLAKFSVTPSLQTLDQNQNILGSVHYMAPEQFERQPLDPRTDLYSLGCVFYFALAQDYPFAGEAPANIMMSHLQHDVMPLGRLRHDLPAGYTDWIMRLISRNPDDRPASAMAALTELRSIEKNQGVVPIGKPISGDAPVGRIIPALDYDTTTSHLSLKTGPVTAKQRLATPHHGTGPAALLHKQAPPPATARPRDNSLRHTLIISAVILALLGAVAAVFFRTSGDDPITKPRSSGKADATGKIAASGAGSGGSNKKPGGGGGNRKPGGNKAKPKTAPVAPPKARLAALPKPGNRLLHFAGDTGTFADNKAAQPAGEGDHVRRWEDLAQSGGNNFLFQGSVDEARQPTLERVTDQHGLKGSFLVLDFEEGHHLTVDRAGLHKAAPLSSDFDDYRLTIFTVFRTEPDRAQNRLLSIDQVEKNTAFKIDHARERYRGGWPAAPPQKRFSEAQATAGSFNLASYVCDAKAGTQRFQLTTPSGVKAGGKPKPAEISSMAFQRFRIGTWKTNKSKPADHFSGQVAELIVYNTALSDAEIAQVEAYLADKYFGARAGGS